MARKKRGCLFTLFAIVVFGGAGFVLLSEQLGIDPASLFDTEAGVASFVPDATAEDAIVARLAAAGVKERYAAVEGGRSLVRFSVDHPGSTAGRLMAGAAVAAAELGGTVDVVVESYYLGDPYMRLSAASADVLAVGKGGPAAREAVARMVWADLRPAERRISDALALAGMPASSVTVDGRNLAARFDARAMKASDLATRFVAGVLAAGSVAPWLGTATFAYVDGAGGTLTVSVDVATAAKRAAGELPESDFAAAVRVERSGSLPFGAPGPEAIAAAAVAAGDEVPALADEASTREALERYFGLK